MSEHAVRVFFYGSYMSFPVLAEAGIGERPCQVARAPGWRLTIAPLANLVADDSAEAFGTVTELTHAELERLYAGHARTKLGAIYLPEAIIVEVADKGSVPALCYLCHDMQPSTPDPAYVERILAPATEYGFPAAFLDHIRSFK